MERVSVMVPETLRYTKDHEWIRLEPNGDAVVGITDYAQHELGDITFVDLPQPGRAVKAHDALAVVESVKAAGDVYAPVAGVVAAVNDALVDAPETVNREPYGAGWLVKIRVTDESGLAGLMDHAAYQKQCESEGGH